MKEFVDRIKNGVRALVVKYHFVVPPSEIKKFAEYLWKLVTTKQPKLLPENIKMYNDWLGSTAKATRYVRLTYQPLISVLIPVYNVEEKYLVQCIESVLGQSYENYEICIVDDASRSQKTKQVLLRYGRNPKIKIKYRKVNGHISQATNDALKMAQGDFVALLDNDDLLDHDALYEVAYALNQNPKLDLIYTDEDKIDMDGRRCSPHFKPDFSPDTLLSMNYICHLTVVRTSLLRKIGGFEVGMEGAQDYDMVLKVVENTNGIYHIPKVLYHWRMLESSTAYNNKSKNYALKRNEKALERAIERRGLAAEVFYDRIAEHYGVIYKVKREPIVSIIIPIKDMSHMTRNCLSSIYQNTTYCNFEVIVVDNRSEEKETFRLLEEYKKKYDNFSVIRADIEFNYSRLNNLAVKKAKGDFLILLNNDTEIITPEWIEMLVGYASQSHIGAVGAKLLYGDGTVQHVGVVLGLGGVAAHAFRGVSVEEVGYFARNRMPYDWGAVTAACLCIEKKKFLKVGGLEEKIKVAFNDVDLCLKLLEAGYYNVVVPQVKLYHFESKSRKDDDTPEKQKRFDDERKYMLREWGKYLKRDPFYNQNLSLKRDFVLNDEKEKNGAE